ncbi:CpaF family protein [Paenibacillus sambharensis]|uniref:CpaF family protein n=1 Tax=Paenibacillus sambharensis TaxID=1803190 RepID=A0A2W1LL45_9BACL|nr:ATPase, T2SS/T4P/T4SS family [Paenibacillus sambharensis]PZD95682.1 CpaF family protein [Paenibacillus sambharensis]
MKPGSGRPEEVRFSPADYAARLRLAMPENEGAEIWRQDAAESRNQDLQRLAEEIRNYLAAPRGMTEEERKGYGERLNRAVLGFPRERAEILAVITDRLIRQRIHRLPGGHHPYRSLADALFAEVVGLNVLELVLANKEGLEEIQVVGTRIYEVRGGEAVMSEHRFASVKEVERIQQNLVLYNNDRITPRKRWAEVSLSDGSRVTLTGFGFTAEPTLTIRFYTVRHYDLDTLCAEEYGTMDKQVKELLLAVLHVRRNLVVIGATNSGKTHLLKALLAELPDEERIITIEGRHEMMLGRDFPAMNVIEYEVDEEDPLHRSMQAFKLALRQSPRRIVHAEIRDEDANIYVRACTRGHSGSMTTVHANELEDVPEAITDMCMLDGRAMNAERLARRITRYVTQVGIEMRIIGGKRRVARIGAYEWREGSTHVRNLAVYDEQRNGWMMDEEAVRGTISGWKGAV